MRIASLQGPLEIGVDYWRYLPASKMDQISPPFFNPFEPHNIGDWFLTKIIDRMLVFDELVLVHQDARAQEWEFVNNECDFLVLRGGNYIQPDWLTKNIGLDALRRIKIPIILFGAGIQAPLGKSIQFEPDEVEALKYIHASCAMSSVRGHSTAEALAAVGITNVAVTGCPTVFWSRSPRLAIREPDDSRGGFTFRQGLYSSDPAMYQSQIRAIETLRAKFRAVTLFLQGEEVLLQRYLAGRDWGAEFDCKWTQIEGLRAHRLERRSVALDELENEIRNKYTQCAQPDFADWIMKNTFFSWDIGEYLREFRSIGLMLGCRLHGNLLSLATGTPAFFLTYDQRTQEVVDLFEIPGCRLTEFDEEVDLISQDWTKFENHYSLRYREMIGFLEKNGLDHRLSPPDSGASIPDHRGPSLSNPIEVKEPTVEYLLGLIHQDPAVDKAISPNDGMYENNELHYFGVGTSALRCIKLALLTANRGNPDRILDFPCGHGRVLRNLRAEFPLSRITACDLDPDAVEFCKETFGAIPIYSAEEPQDIGIQGPFDLIWCGSLLTHMDADRWSDFLRMFTNLLAPGGMLVFSTHGRSVCDRLSSGVNNYGLHEDAVDEILRMYVQSGFGYSNYSTACRYGISVSSPAWVCSQLANLPHLQIIGYHERAWDGHHDIVSCTRVGD